MAKRRKVIDVEFHEVPQKWWQWFPLIWRRALRQWCRMPMWVKMFAAGAVPSVLVGLVLQDWQAALGGLAISATFVGMFIFED